MRNTTATPGSGTPSSASSPSANIARRRFLFTLGAGGAGVAAASVAALPAAAAIVTPTAEPTAATSGYRETDHVRDYYRTARI